MPSPRAKPALGDPDLVHRLVDTGEDHEIMSEQKAKGVKAADPQVVNSNPVDANLIRSASHRGGGSAAGVGMAPKLTVEIEGGDAAGAAEGAQGSPFMIKSETIKPAR
eukprot:gene18966-25541_t